MYVSFRSLGLALAAMVAAPALLQGQTPPPPAWLRYTIPPDPPRYHDMPHEVVLLGDAPEEKTAADELDRGLGHMVAGTDNLLHRFDAHTDAIVLGTPDALRRVRPHVLTRGADAPLAEDAYRIRHVRLRERQWWVLEGGSPRAELYAAFRFAALVAEDRQLPDTLAETAKIPLRAVDLRGDLAGMPAGGLLVMARLMASVGLNGLLVDGGGAGDAQHLVSTMRPYGIRVWLRGAPAEAAIAAGAAGIVVPANADLKRLSADVAKADAAARTLRKHGGSVVLEGAFEGAWMRETAGADQRAPLLKTMEPNVLLLSEAVPPSLPLAGLASSGFGLLPGAPQMASVPLFPAGTEAVVFPASTWESVLATPERGVHEDGTLAEMLSHKGGMVAQVRVVEWTAMLREPLLQANLFGFGRVAWNPSEPAGEMAEAWARQTFGDDARAFGVAKEIVLKSAEAFAEASSPLGLPWLGDGGRPDPSRAARQNDASLPLASAEGIGIDRTGEDLAGYPQAFAAELADPAKTPERLLLAAHRVPPGRRMANGKTVVQAFYDTHFAGASQMSNALDAWESTRGLVDADRYAAVHEQLALAARRSEVWRDSTTEWMERASGVKDEARFVGDHPGRVEAETMTLHGYSVRRAEEAEDASGSGYVACILAPCSAENVFRGETNVYRVEVGYYDAAEGGTLTLLLNGVPQAQWAIESGAGRPTSATAERFAVNGVRLKPGDRLSITGQAALDFVDVTRDPRWN